MARTLSPAKAEFMARQQARRSYVEWCKIANNGLQPAKHHLLIIKEVQDLVANLFKALLRGYVIPEEPLNLMVMTPPGSAKSTYISKCLPPWFLAQMSYIAGELAKACKPVIPLGILGCSHSSDYAAKWGKMARDLIPQNERWLGYKIKQDSRATDEWAVTNGGYYKAAGVGKGISGDRMHLGFIDDFCGLEADAGSKLFNDGIWIWFENDFKNRLQPIAAVIIIANHRNEDDLCGRILAKEGELKDPKTGLLTRQSKWRVIRLRLLIEDEEQAEQDPLGRKVGDYLWPEYFTREQVNDRMTNPRASGIQQQEPSPEAGAFFIKEKLSGYTVKELPSRNECQVYGSSDHAVRTKQQNDPSCLGLGFFQNGFLFIHPDIIWDRIPTDRAVKEMLRYASTYHPLFWWAEKENISGSIGPFLRNEMHKSGDWMAVFELSHKNKDKMANAQSAHALAMSGLIRFPKFATWWSRAERELLMFPNGTHDDFVSFLSNLGKGIRNMTSPNKQVVPVVSEPPVGFNITPRIIHEAASREKRLRMLSDR